MKAFITEEQARLLIAGSCGLISGAKENDLMGAWRFRGFIIKEISSDLEKARALRDDAKAENQDLFTAWHRFHSACYYYEQAINALMNQIHEVENV